MKWYGTYIRDSKSEDNSEDGDTENEINWLKFGLDEKNVNSKEIIDYLSNECSIYK